MLQTGYLVLVARFVIIISALNIAYHHHIFVLPKQSICEYYHTNFAKWINIFNLFKIEVMKLMKQFTVVLMLCSFALFSCSSANKTTKGSALGAGAGAVLGGIIGSLSGHVGVGAIIGAAVGGGAGAIIGHKMDKQAAEMQKDLPSAKVERVGEGIVIEFSDKVLFSIGKSDLSAASKSSLDKLFALLVKYPDTNIEIQGHTDNTGTQALNLKLSQKRADAVKGYLSTKGIDAARLTSKGFGEDSPQYSNDTEEGRSQNRNVLFVISANEKMKADATKEAGTK
jgi:outer membrane protein OmpA-like peptidoglycan-associated protein